MPKYVKFVILSVVMAIMLTGCNAKNDGTTDVSVSEIDTSFAKNDAEMFTDRDFETSYDVTTATLIELNGDSVSCASVNVRISGTTVEITAGGTYIVSGALTDGRIVVNAGDNDKPHVVFNGASVTSATSASFYVMNADKVFVTLAENTENAFSNGGSFVSVDQNNIDGAIFSKDDLTFNGTGILSVTSPAGHGIVCKDDLVFTGGTYNISAKSHGIDANDSIRIKNSVFSVESGKDGFHSDNSDDTSLGFIYVSGGEFDVTAGDDGISGSGFIQAEGGTFNVDAGTQSSNDNTSLKGLKSAASILINGGDFVIQSSDDAVHSNLSIIVNGGTFVISSGDDGFHADEHLYISAGTIVIEKSYEGLESLNLVITGGNIKIFATDDGLNAAGGTDSSGFGGVGTPPNGGGRPGDKFGGNSSNSNGSIKISGGELYIQACGDGIDSNGSLEISGGNITVCGPTSGDTAVLDYDTTGTISGGTFCGSGSYMMAQTLTGNGQGVLGVSVGNQSAGTEVTVKDSKGNVVISFTPALSFQIVIISSPDIVQGDTYTLIVGSISGTITAK